MKFKKLLSALTLIFCVSFINAQNHHYRGVKFPNATEQTDVDKIPLMKFNSNKINYWISPENFKIALGIGESQNFPYWDDTTDGVSFGRDFAEATIKFPQSNYYQGPRTIIEGRTIDLFSYNNFGLGVRSFDDFSILNDKSMYFYTGNSLNGVSLSQTYTRINSNNIADTPINLELPNSSGTLALVSDIPSAVDLSNYVDLTTNQLIEGVKTFEDEANFNNSVHDNVYANGIVIDDLNTTTSIAGSELTVKKLSTASGTNVNSFFDVNRNNSISGTTETYGLISRVINNSSFNDTGVIGANNVGRHSGSGNLEYAYGVINTAEYTGSGNIDFLIPSVNRAKVSGSGVGLIDYIRGNSITIDNPNITVNYAQGHHPAITLNNGNLINGHVMYLDADYTGGSITGEFAYLRAGVDSDVMGALSGNSNAYFIKSEINLPSEFKGKLSSDVDVLEITEDKDLTTKKYVDDNFINKTNFYEEGNFSPTISDAGGGATYTYSGPRRGSYTRVGNSVTFNIEISHSYTTGTPTGLFQIENLPFPLGVSPSSSSSQQTSAVSVGSFTNTDIIGINSVNAYVANNTGNPVIYFIVDIDNSSSQAIASSVTINNSFITVSGTYITNVYTP